MIKLKKPIIVMSLLYLFLSGYEGIINQENTIKNEEKITTTAPIIKEKETSKIALQTNEVKNKEEAKDESVINNVDLSYSALNEEHKSIVLENSKKYNVDPHLVLAIIRQESSNNPKATSYANAKGYGQFMDSTAKWVYEQKLKLGKWTPDKSYDPEINIKMTCWYISYLIKECGSVYNALAYYSGSESNYYNDVLRYYKKG